MRTFLFFVSHLSAEGTIQICNVRAVLIVVEARLLRFLEAKNVMRGGELMWMDLLIVDVNVESMFLTMFQMCEELLTHRFVFVDLTEPVSPLPEKAFRFHNQSELIGLANTNTLP
ncbi:hypothetical protein IGI04_014609, partial [Brassica rapa subsp. trilocularis]